jgi:oligopeptide transport system substrate-binding protein
VNGGRAVLLISVVVSAACRRESASFGPADPVHSKDTVILSNASEPRSIDPGLASESAGIEIASNCFEGLTTFAPKTPLSPAPGIASSWEVLDGGRRYVFHLRDSVWSDGVPLTADDFVYAWRRALLPVTASEYAYQLWYIKGAKPFNDGTVADAATVAVRAIDPHTLEVTLEQPTPFFLFLTTFATLSAVPRQAIERWGNRWTQPEHMVVNGAYKVVRWALQDEIVLEKNDRYWNAAHVPIRRVVSLANDNNQSVTNLYRTGDVDSTSPNSRPPLAAVPTLRHYTDYSEHPFLATYWYWFNVRRPPFNNLKVRQAFARAVDKKRLIDSLLHGVNVPSWTVVPDLFANVSGYRPPVGPDDRFDPEGARRLLAEAGYPGGKGFPSVRLAFNPDDQHRLIAEAVQAMWKDTLGVQVEIPNVEWKQLLSEMHDGNFDLARSGWQADYPEPSTFLSVFFGESGQNDAGWKNEAFDRTMHQALAEPDQVKRNVLYAKAERMLLDELPMLPIYSYTKEMLAAPKLGGLESNLLDLHLYKDLYWR